MPLVQRSLYVPSFGIGSAYVVSLAWPQICNSDGPATPSLTKPVMCPGPPVQFGYTFTNATVEAGFGYTGTGAVEELDRYFYHPDHIGSSSVITNALGAVSECMAYMPFGEILASQKSTSYAVPYLFTSKELDNETGLYYFGARYYDPNEGRWWGVDPLAEKFSSISPFTYCLNNPIKLTDPNGLEPQNKKSDGWVVFIQAEGRIGAPFWGKDKGLGVCHSSAFGIIMDHNYNIAAYYTPTIGISYGEAYVAGVTYGAFPYGDDVSNIAGLGFNIGVLASVPGLIFSAEWNMALPTNAGDMLDRLINSKNGFSIGDWKRSTGAGMLGYFDFSYTFMTKSTNLLNMSPEDLANFLNASFGKKGNDKISIEAANILAKTLLKINQEANENSEKLKQILKKIIEPE